MRLIVLMSMVCGCGADYQYQELPTLYDRDYAPIDYIDSYTRQEWTISRFWAQEAIGTPEARTFLQQLADEGFSLNDSKVGVVDSGFSKGILAARLTSELQSVVNDYDFSSLPNEKEKHGTRVVNLIAGQAPAGVSSRAEVAFLSDRSIYRVTAKYLPRVVNYSMGFVQSYLSLAGGGFRKMYLLDVLDDDDKDSLTQVLDRAILVKSAGNDFPAPPSNDITSYGHRMVVVGSVDPSGFVSWFSQTSEQVVLLAPSDGFLGVFNDGNSVFFGGTSGSAPLVTAVVADLRSILPDLTREQIVYLLRKTAIVSGAKLVNENIAYIINHYLALRVAQRLADQGSHRLKDSQIYDFNAESWQMFVESKVAPSYRQKFFKLRLAFFLNPANLTIRDELSKIYRQCGYDNQSLMYSQPYHGEARYKAQLRNNYAMRHFLVVERDNFTKWLKNVRKVDRAKIATTTAELDAIKRRAISRAPKIEAYDWGDALVTYIEGASDALADSLRQYARATYPEMLNNETLNQLLDSH